MRKTWIVMFCLVGLCICIEQDFKGFDDTILFGINWPGDTLEKLVDGQSEKPQKEKEIIRVRTAQQESYVCHLPEIKTKENTSVQDYDGPLPIQLLKPLFAQKICSYRLESYWSYEVCHGRYIRQYHEERDGKQIKTQEYYLGHWSIEKQMDLNSIKEEVPLKTIKVEGTTLPYVEMVMDDGTICDLSGKPRKTSIKYVCYSHGKHEVYSFKETSTCEYEIIILSPLLCEHPLFKPKDASENIINCLPLGDAPKKPRALLKMEAESLKFNHQTYRLMNSDYDKEAKDVLAVLKVEKVEKDGETHLKLELHPLNDEDLTSTSPSIVGDNKLPMTDKPPIITDDTPVRAFLQGENCLNGGTGWWKYEFCYGRHVMQYHIDRSGDKTTLMLGKFNEEDHLNWIKENKGKAPKPVGQRTSISHFYSDGDVCDKTGKPRQTEVKLKCLENSSSPAQVSLYLLEPRTCHYILGVESPLICEILPLADENGLVKQTKPILVRQDAVDSEPEEDTTIKKVIEKVEDD